MLISSRKPYSSYVSEEESKPSKSNGTLGIDVTLHAHPRQWSGGIKRHNTFLHSEPIVQKIVYNDQDSRDSFGLEVGKKYVDVEVRGTVGYHTFTYKGDWFGGKL